MTEFTIGMAAIVISWVIYLAVATIIGPISTIFSRMSRFADPATATNAIGRPSKQKSVQQQR